MKKNKYFIIIGVCIIIICIVLYGIHYIGTRTFDNDTSSYKGEIDKENAMENTSNVNEQINTDTEDYIFYHEEETGDAKYTTEQLDNVSFEISGISSDLKKYISSENSFEIAVKEFIYKHGLIDSSTGNVTKWELKEDSNKLIIYMELDNDSKTTLLISENLNNGEIKVYKYK